MGTAGCLIALSGLSLGQDVPQEDEAFEPTWSSWTGIPMEPVWAWDQFFRPIAVQASAAEPKQAKPEPPKQVQGGPLVDPAEEPQDEANPDTDQVALDQLAPEPVEESPAEPPAMPWDALDLELYRRATASVPPGIPVSRAAERLAETELAAAELAVALTGDQGSLWLDYLASELQFQLAAPKRWANAAQLVVKLELFQLAPLVAKALDQPKDTYVRQAAWASLAELFGVRRETAAEWQEIAASPFTPDSHAELREQASLSRERLLELFTFRLADAAISINDVDPLVRAGCAVVLGSALLAGTVDSDSTLDVLLSRLEIEHRPRVVDALLEATFTTLEGRSAGDPRVARLRSILAQAAQSTAPTSELLIARGLARLSWPSTEPMAASSLESGAALLSTVLRRVSEVGPADSGEQRDADVLFGVLKALDRLCRGVGGDSETSLRLGANVDRSPLLQLVLRDEFAPGVRELAAGTLPRVAPPEDIAVLIEVLSDKQTDLSSELRYALLGAVGRFVERDDAAPEYSAPVLSCLLDHTGHSEELIREHALGLLLSDGISAEISQDQAKLYLARLDLEQTPSLQDKLLLLIGRYGDASMLDGVLELKSFDALVARGPASEKAMLDLVAQLAGTKPAARFSAAERFYKTVNPGLQISPGIHALSLVAELSATSLLDLSSQQHQAIARWAVELRVYGVDLAKDIPNGVDLLDHLVNVHVPSSGTGEAYSQPEKELMQALFLSDIAATKTNGEAKAMESEVLAKFATALELAPQHSESNFSMLVRHARARFRSKPDSFGLAFIDYSIIFNSPERTLLDPGDLRSASKSALAQARVRAESAAIVAGTSPNAIPEQSRVPTAGDQLSAFQFSLALVSHESWQREPETVRFEDLRNLATTAAASGDRKAVSAVNSLFKGLPKVVAESQGVGEGPATSMARPWSGLDTTAEHLTELNRLHVVIQQELGRLTVQDTTAEEVDLASESDVDEGGATEQAPDKSGQSGDSTPAEDSGQTNGTTPIVPGGLWRLGLEGSSQSGI
ncbi:MAG: hypothetical protein P8N31_11765 [Planctomycetota bacterium]|nr:hypothetical protein [Planctomycetota bacterium]